MKPDRISSKSLDQLYRGYHGDVQAFIQAHFSCHGCHNHLPITSRMDNESWFADMTNPIFYFYCDECYWWDRVNRNGFDSLSQKDQKEMIERGIWQPIQNTGSKWGKIFL